jgi:hypothetical protein
VTAYARYPIGTLLLANAAEILGTLQQRYAQDGFASQYTQQTKAWDGFISVLQAELTALVADCPDAANWGVLLEYPLYRLRKRIDAVILTTNQILVLEAKVGENQFRAEDERQVEDYALDLRDFHAGCRDHVLIPVLWCTNAPEAKADCRADPVDGVTPVQRVGTGQLRTVLRRFVSSHSHARLVLDKWDAAPYQPVPTIIQAATSIFAGHDVRDIARADASNLAVSARRIVDIIAGAKRDCRKIVVFLTGVPGAGKTLAGLQVVHDAVTTGTEDRGDIVYLSGNTPLVVVLREALAQDTVERKRAAGARSGLADERRLIRTRIQHINDFLKQYLSDTTSTLPHEHAIVFDEAQRAWDARQGAKKFKRQQSEPALLLEIMSRHTDWCACVCLVGGGQEINTGEEGISGWGDALRNLVGAQSRWAVYGPEDVFHGGASTGGLALGELPAAITSAPDQDLRLSVPLRSYRSPAMSEWVKAVLDANLPAAKAQAQLLTAYPIVLTRCLNRARTWLRERGRGERRYGLLASSGARRLRADGLGEILQATHGPAIAQWYLNGRDDIRSSFALEVPANEYACQGLEIDFSCVCWGGDLLFAPQTGCWLCRRLSGNAWHNVGSVEDRRYVRNTYRVLLTRAREGLVIWVPRGDESDRTRSPEELDATADFLVAAGARILAAEGVPR